MNNLLIRENWYIFKVKVKISLIIFYCISIPDQNNEVDAVFKDLKVYNLEGSIFKWANETRTIVDVKGQPTKFVHPYSRLWGLLVDRSRWKWSANKD